jgi:hypothetical protein
MEEAPCKVVSIGPNRTSCASSQLGASKKKYQCILCQEEEEIKIGNPPMVLCCYIQSSKVLSKNRSERAEDFEKSDLLFMKSVITWGINTTSCGHTMHAVCWQK